MNLAHLAFEGPTKAPALIKFGSGLNLVFGPSNTGKSSIFDAIDFMLGRERKLKEIPEHEGYENVLLGVSLENTDGFTLVRSLSGGDVKCFDGLHEQVPDTDKFLVLKLKKPTKKLKSLPDFLLEKIGLAKKHLKKNARNETERLTLRNFTPLFLINETNIQSESSPYISPQHTKKTVERSRLKLILTGVDDSSLVPEEKEKQRYSRQARLLLLEEIINEQREKIADSINENDEFADLQEQNERLLVTISAESNSMQSTEAEYRNQINQRNIFRHQVSQQEERSNEIEEMLGRFDLLQQQYISDTSRLQNIIEAGTLLGGLPLSERCPVCGASTADNGAHEFCDENTEDVIAAAHEELDKIGALNNELETVILKLKQEKSSIGLQIPITLEHLKNAQQHIDTISPIVSDQRARYSELIETKSAVDKSMDLFVDLKALEEKQKDIEAEEPDIANEENVAITLPTNALFELSSRVSSFLQSWGLANSENVHFDKENDDFVIGGKLRTSNGKGHRAITHAAASLALLKYSEEKKTNYPNFILLDSPLLAYEKPDDDEDDLSGTDVNLKFFRSLEKWKEKQIIVFENKKSIPVEFQIGDQITQFTKSSEDGRYGFFPQNMN